MRRNYVKNITLAAVVAALYTALTYVSNILGLAYGPVQFRLSEALCVLPFLFPATAPGLFVGCLITNFLSPYGLVDIVCGSLATGLAAALTIKMPNKWLAPLPAVVLNGVIIGGMLAWYEVGFGAGFWQLSAINGAWVAVGEIGTCFVLGMILLNVFPRVSYFRTMITPKHLPA